jgi:hypothetical protein
VRASISTRTNRLPAARHYLATGRSSGAKVWTNLPIVALRLSLAVIRRELYHAVVALLFLCALHSAET